MSGSFFKFEDASLIRVSGRDALRYLNARLTANPKILLAGHHTPAAALTAQGRTEAYFTLANCTDNYLLLAHFGDRSQILRAFRKFIVADQVQTETLHESFALYRVTSAELGKLLPKLASPSGTGTLPEIGKLLHSEAFTCLRINDLSLDIMLLNDQAAAFEAALQSAGLKNLTSAEYHLERIKSKNYTYPFELNEQSLFLEAGLTGAVAENKGCYVGQETVEMVKARGKLPAHICSLVSPQPINIEVSSDLHYQSASDSNLAGRSKVLSLATSNTETVFTLRLKDWESFRTATIIVSQGELSASCYLL